MFFSADGDDTLVPQFVVAIFKIILIMIFLNLKKVKCISSFIIMFSFIKITCFLSMPKLNEL